MQRLSHCTKDSTLEVYLDSPDSAFLLDAEIIPQTRNKASGFNMLDSYCREISRVAAGKRKNSIRWKIVSLPPFPANRNIYASVRV